MIKNFRHLYSEHDDSYATLLGNVFDHSDCYVSYLELCLLMRYVFSSVAITKDKVSNQIMVNDQVVTTQREQQPTW